LAIKVKELVSYPSKVNMADILLLNATVATMNKCREIFKDGAVAIEGNKIIEVGKSKKVK